MFLNIYAKCQKRFYVIQKYIETRKWSEVFLKNSTKRYFLFFQRFTVQDVRSLDKTAFNEFITQTGLINQKTGRHQVLMTERSKVE